jgi:hypothetical protein
MQQTCKVRKAGTPGTYIGAVEELAGHEGVLGEEVLPHAEHEEEESANGVQRDQGGYC